MIIQEYFNYKNITRTCIFITMQSIRKCAFHFELDLDPNLDFYVRSTGDFLLIPPDREKRRHVNFNEIFWCISGKGIFKLDEEEGILRPDYVWYYPAGSFHDYWPVGEHFHYCWLAIAGKSSTALFNGLCLKPGLNYAGSCPVHLFARIAEFLRKKTLISNLEALALGFQILTQVSSGRHRKAPRGGIAEEAKKIIDSGFTDYRMNVTEIAAQLKVHPGSLSRAYSSGYGVPIIRYLTSCRIRHALVLLRETNLPVAQIARMSGFFSHEYFTRVFSAGIGVPPQKFRINTQNISAMDDSQQGKEQV